MIFGIELTDIGNAIFLLLCLIYIWAIVHVIRNHNGDDF